MQIRPLVESDYHAVLGLNEESVKALSPLAAANLEVHRRDAAHAVVCEVDSQVVGFALAYAPESTYESLNYRWHHERFADFLYLDRIAISSAWRRRGIATAMYDELETYAAAHGRMVCEVNSEPPNPESLAFHAHRGYRPIGRLRQPDGHETVMMEKPL